MSDTDVAIAGGGPAGLLLGCLLARAGRRVAVLERSAGRDGRSRAIGIHPPGLAALRRAGIADAVRAEATALAGGVVTSRGRMLADLDLPPERPVLTLAQSRTEDLLTERLRGLAADALRTGVTVTGLEERADHVVVTVSAGAHSTSELSAGAVVIADGVYSALRTLIGFGWRRVPGAADYSMLDVPRAAPDDRARLHLEPEGVVESFPLPGGGRRWVIRERGRTNRSVDSFRAAVWTRTGAGVGEAEDAVPSAFHARQHRAERLVRGRIVLLGDAAHEISPIGGQGMNVAWIGAVRLAVALTERSDAATALAAYERATARTAARAQARAQFNMAMGAPLAGPALAARDLAIRAVAASPWSGRLLETMTMGGL